MAGSPAHPRRRPLVHRKPNRTSAFHFVSLPLCAFVPGLSLVPSVVFPKYIVVIWGSPNLVRIVLNSVHEAGASPGTPELQLGMADAMCRVDRPDQPELICRTNE